MPDPSTTLAEMRKCVQNFVTERDWEQFHAPKNLAMSLAIEAAELMEHFQWLTVEESRKIAEQPETLEEVADELADVFCYAFAMANATGIDISTAVLRKMEKNAQKYPADAFRGRAR